MTALFAIVLMILAIAAVSPSQTENKGLKLESLCYVSEEKCHHNDAVNPPQTLDEMSGYYCLSGPDFKKIVNKLQSVQDK